MFWFYLFIGLIIGLISTCILIYISIKNDYDYFEDYEYVESDYANIMYVAGIFAAIVFLWPIYLFIMFFIIIVIIIIYFIKKKVKKR